MPKQLSRTVSVPHRGADRLRVPRFVMGWVVLLLIVLAPSAAAQETGGSSVPQVFMNLEGHWTGAGVLLGRPAEFEMRWEIDDEGFVHLSFKNAWVNADGDLTPVLSAAATYYPSGSSAPGVWIDDRPQRLTLDAVLTDSSVTTLWTAEGEKGRTEYRVQSPQAVVVRDFVFVDGSERLFAEGTYERTPGPR